MKPSVGTLVYLTCSNIWSEILEIEVQAFSHRNACVWSVECAPQDPEAGQDSHKCAGWNTRSGSTFSTS